MKVRLENSFCYSLVVKRSFISNAGTNARPRASADLSPDARSYLEAQNASLTTYNVELGYDYWTAGSFFGHVRVSVSHSHRNP